MLREVGPYRLLKKLGAGGMGEVHLAEHVRHGQRCALKLLRPADEEEALRFVREAQAHVAAGRHPHVVEVFESGRQEGLCYLALGLVEGGDLLGRLAKDGPLDPDDAARLCREVALGVAHLHAVGVLHRDLKPANVLLDPDGRARVTDFGLARLSGAHTLTQTGELLGTPVYMAPEQAKGEVQAYGPATDVYGLGGVLYACLTGQPPVSSRGSLLPTLQAVLDELPAAPSALRPGVPPWLDAVCLRALAKAPEERYSSARELADALRGPSPAREASGGKAWALGGLACLGALALGYALASQPKGGAVSPSPEVSASPAAKKTPAPASAAPINDLGAYCERLVREIAATSDPQERIASQLELLRLCHQRHQPGLLEAMARALEESQHAREATYRLADAGAASAKGEEARRALLRLGDDPGPWGTLARARLALESSLPRPEAQRHVTELERELAKAPEPALKALLGQARDLVSVFAGEPDEGRLGRVALAADVRALIPLAQLRAKRLGRGSDSALAELLARAKRLCLPRGLPPELEACELLLLVAQGQDVADLRARAESLAGALSPWRTTKLLAQLGVELEAQDPLAAFELWRRAPKELLSDWIEDLQREGDQTPQLRALTLRLQRAAGAPAREVLDAAQRELAFSSVRDFPDAADRQLAVSALDLALKGAPWEELQQPVAQLVGRGPEGVLLGLELMFGRDQLERAFKLYKEHRAAFSEASLTQNTRLGLLLLSFGIGSARRSARQAPEVQALLRGAGWKRSGAKSDWEQLREVLQPALQGPAWARRLAGYFAQLHYPLAARRDGVTTLAALYGRALFQERLQRLRSRRDQASLEGAVRALRVTSHPLARTSLVWTLLVELPDLAPAYSRSIQLWLAEASRELALPGWKTSRAAIRRDLLLAEGLYLLRHEGSAADVRRAWREALGGEALDPALEEVFRARFGEPYGGPDLAEGRMAALEEAISSAPDDATRLALRLDLVRLCHARHRPQRLKQAADALAGSPHEREASYRWADALAATRECDEAHQRLRALARQGDAWGILAKARLALEDAQPAAEKLTLRSELIRSREASPLPGLSELSRRVEQQLFARAGRRPELAEPAGDDVRALIPVLTRHACTPTPESAAPVRALATRARTICAGGELPVEVEEMQLYSSLEREKDGAELMRRARDVAGQLSPGRATRLLVSVGHRIERLGGPLVAFRLWQESVEPAEGLRLVKSLAAEGWVAAKAFELRLERAFGAGAQAPLTPSGRALIERCTGSLPEEDRASAQATLEQALGGATGAKLTPLARGLLERHLGAQLLGLEVLLGRDRVRTVAEFLRARRLPGEAEPRAAMLALVLAESDLTATREQAPYVSALIAAKRARQQGVTQARLREQLAPAREGPAWARRLADLLELRAFGSLSPEERAEELGALDGQAYFARCLRELEQRGDLPTLLQAVRALRVVSSPLPRLQLALASLRLEDRELREGLRISRLLWSQEAQNLAQTRLWGRLRPRVESMTQVARGLDFLYQGKPRAEVDACWARALKEDRPGPALRRLYEQRFGAPYESGAR